MGAAFSVHFERSCHWIVDLETLTVVDCSDSAARLWGYSNHQMLRLHAEQLLHADEIHRARLLRQEHISGDTGIWKCVRQDGKVFYAHIIARKGVLNGRLCSFSEVGIGGTAASLAEVQQACLRSGNR